MGIVLREPQQPLDVLDDWVEGRVLVERRAAALYTGIDFVCQPLGEDLQQTGFADARLATEQYDLAFPKLGLLPEIH